MRIELRPITAEHLPRIAEVDRSETVRAKYVARRTPDGVGLTLVRVGVEPPEELPHWSEQGAAGRAAEWGAKVRAGGTGLGAFDGEALVGFAVIGPMAADDTVELVALFVHAGYRGRGIGEMLMRAAEGAAKARGARAMWIASSATASAVEFYLRHGCQLLKLCDNSDVPHQVGDPMFVRVLT
jgi:GNAT superfamily N-acetyltransferase